MTPVHLDVEIAIHPPAGGGDEGGDGELDEDVFDAALEAVRATARPTLTSAWASVRAAALHHDRVPSEAEIRLIEDHVCYPSTDRASHALHQLIEVVSCGCEHSAALRVADKVLSAASPEKMASDPILGSLAELVALLCEAPIASPDYPDIHLRALEALRLAPPVNASWFGVRS